MAKSSRRKPETRRELAEAVDRLTRQAEERGWRPATACPSNKVCYASASAAVAAARSMYLRGKKLADNKSHYRCPTCGAWHLTSMGTPT